MYVVKEVLSGEETFDLYCQVVFIGSEHDCDEYVASHKTEEYDDEYYYEKTEYKKYTKIPAMLWSDTRELYPSTGKLIVDIDIEGNHLSKYPIDNEVLSEIQALLAK